MVAGTIAAREARESDTGIGGATASMFRATGVGGSIEIDMKIEMTFFWVGAITVWTDSIGGTHVGSGDAKTFDVVK
jgi:hypothetical protein